jgi:hypothetical protein
LAGRPKSDTEYNFAVVYIQATLFGKGVNPYKSAGLTLNSRMMSVRVRQAKPADRSRADSGVGLTKLCGPIDIKNRQLSTCGQVSDEKQDVWYLEPGDPFLTGIAPQGICDWRGIPCSMADSEQEVLQKCPHLKDPGSRCPLP